MKFLDRIKNFFNGDKSEIENKIEYFTTSSPLVIDELHENMSAASLIIFGMDGVFEKHYKFEKNYTLHNEDKKLYSPEKWQKVREAENIIQGRKNGKTYRFINQISKQLGVSKFHSSLIIKYGMTPEQAKKYGQLRHIALKHRKGRKHKKLAKRMRNILNRGLDGKYIIWLDLAKGEYISGNYCRNNI